MTVVVVTKILPAGRATAAPGISAGAAQIPTITTIPPARIVPEITKLCAGKDTKACGLGGLDNPHSRLG